MSTGWFAAHAADDCCWVTTTGRRTGRDHEVEIWFGVAGDTLYLISGNGRTADWYRNLLAEPRLTVRLGDESRPAVARPVTDPDERRLVGDVLGAKYPWDGDPSIGLTFEAWCYDVPAVAIEQA